MTDLTFGSLFAGIGGIDLGLERAGMNCLWQVEIDQFCRGVLSKHWPKVPKFGDITAVNPEDLARVSVIAGGFPCQNISQAGKQEGIEDGAKSGLWREFARIVRSIRPRAVIVENVPGLLIRDLGRVLGDLAECGYDAEWDSVSAHAVGAPHIRDRVFVSAYRRDTDSDSEPIKPVNDCETSGVRESGNLSNTIRHNLRELRKREREQYDKSGSSVVRDHGASGALAYTDSQRPTHRGESHAGRRIWPGRDSVSLSGERKERARATSSDRPSIVAYTDSQPAQRIAEPWRQRDHWSVEPTMGRVANGVPRRMDRLRALGNAVVPQCAEVIGRRVVERLGGAK